MSGRIEVDLKTEHNIQLILSELPAFITAYYYSIAPSTTAKTCETYLKQIRGLLRFINSDTQHILPSDITDIVVGQYLKYIQVKQDGNKKQSTSFSYQKTVWSSINGLCIYLYNKKLLPDNPMINIKRPNYQDNVRHIELSLQDLRSILSAVDSGAGNKTAKAKQVQWKERDRLILLLFMETGMRCTALSEIDLQDIDFDRNILTIVDKRHTTHEYYISDQLKNAIAAWLQKRQTILSDNTNALFISSYRDRLTSKGIYNLIKQYSQEALGYSISPHKLRAAFCTILYNETHDIEFVREAVGHKSVNTTSRYIVKKENAKVKASQFFASKILE